MKTILEEANEIINGSRQQDYGDAVESFRRIAEMVKLMTGKDFSPSDCCKVLIAVKLTRESFKHKRDNLVDACGYMNILQLLEEREEIYPTNFRTSINL
jgi:hypothetical protein